MNKQFATGILLAVVTIFIWGAGYLFARMIAGHVSPMLMSLCRWGVAGIIVCIFFLPRIKKEWSLAKKFMPQIILAAFTGYFIFPLFTYYAAQTTAILNISLISVTTGAFIIIILAMMGEKPNIHAWIGCFIALSGSVYLTTNGDLKSLFDLKLATGDIFMLVAAIAFAIYCIALRKPPEGLSNFTTLGIMILLTIVMLIPFAVWDASQPNVVFDLTPKVIAVIIATGSLICVISWWTWNTALTLAGPIPCGMIYYGLSLTSAFYGYFFLNEPVTITHCISGMLIIGGIIWCDHGYRLFPKKNVA